MEGAGCWAPGVPAESKSTNGNNHQGMIFHALIPIIELSSKKNIEREIPFPFRVNVPPQKPKPVETKLIGKTGPTLHWLSSERWPHSFTEGWLCWGEDLPRNSNDLSCSFGPDTQLTKRTCGPSGLCEQTDVGPGW